MLLKDKSSDECFSEGNFDVGLAKLILPKLKEYLECCDNVVPKGMRSNKHWKTTVEKMIYSFEKIQSELSFDEEENKRIQQGLNLFAKYFRAIWT